MKSLFAVILIGCYLPAEKTESNYFGYKNVSWEQKTNESHICVVRSPKLLGSQAHYKIKDNGHLTAVSQNSRQKVCWKAAPGNHTITATRPDDGGSPYYPGPAPIEVAVMKNNTTYIFLEGNLNRDTMTVSNSSKWQAKTSLRTIRIGMREAAISPQQTPASQ